VIRSAANSLDATRQEGPGDAVLSAFVEIVFDNSDHRLLTHLDQDEVCMHSIADRRSPRCPATPCGGAAYAIRTAVCCLPIRPVRISRRCAIHRVRAIPPVSAGHGAAVNRAEERRVRLCCVCSLTIRMQPWMRPTVLLRPVAPVGCCSRAQSTVHRIVSYPIAVLDHSATAVVVLPATQGHSLPTL
jgi:hypothetical protein